MRRRRLSPRRRQVAYRWQWPVVVHLPHGRSRPRCAPFEEWPPGIVCGRRRPCRGAQREREQRQIRGSRLLHPRGGRCGCPLCSLPPDLHTWQRFGNLRGLRFEVNRKRVNPAVRHSRQNACDYEKPEETRHRRTCSKVLAVPGPAIMTPPGASGAQHRSALSEGRAACSGGFHEPPGQALTRWPALYCRTRHPAGPSWRDATRRSVRQTE
jgi:hypothetical protein